MLSLDSPTPLKRKSRFGGFGTPATPLKQPKFTSSQDGSSSLSPIAGGSSIPSLTSGPESGTISQSSSLTSLGDSSGAETTSILAPPPISKPTTRGKQKI